MTKDELTALRRERGKQKLNIGDKVIVHSASDKPLYDGKVATIIEKGISGNEVYYGLYIESVIVEKRSKPLIGAAGIIGTTSLLAPFYAEDLELVKEPTDKDNTITIPVKADFGEDVGIALLDRALELQKKYTELEGEIKRLYELVNDAMNGLHPLRLKFDNCFLSSIACMVCNDFRPLTEEEKAQSLIDIKNMADNLKKQSDAK